MLQTEVTRRLGLRRPIVGAPMAGVARGRLARAVSAAGGLGMIGVGSADPTGLVEQEAAIAGDGGQPFGIGLMAWALEQRPELLRAALAAAPSAVSISFGAPGPYVGALHDAGILVISQVQDLRSAREAVDAGVDVLVAQGTEAGGHTGTVGTLPLLQLVLEEVDVPVLVAGGIATARGLAAVLAAGAAGAWIGTALLACPETASSPGARARVLEAAETDTVLTRVFDLALGIGWPPSFAGRALRNAFTETWHGREADLAATGGAAEALADARRDGNYELAYVYAGQAVGLVREARPAAEVVAAMCDGAEQLLRARLSLLQPAPPPADEPEPATTAAGFDADGEGGDAACWAHLLCEECGAVLSEGHRPGCASAPVEHAEHAEHAEHGGRKR